MKKQPYMSIYCMLNPRVLIQVIDLSYTQSRISLDLCYYANMFNILLKFLQSNFLCIGFRVIIGPWFCALFSTIILCDKLWLVICYFQIYASTIFSLLY